MIVPVSWFQPPVVQPLCDSQMRNPAPDFFQKGNVR